MGIPWLHEERTWRGHWWLPDDPSDTHAGFLTFRPEAGVELVLMGGFDDEVRRRIGPGAWAVMAEAKDFPVIHGFAGGKAVTLITARAAGSKTYGMGLVGAGPDEQTIKAQTALVGVHLDSPDQVIFTKADFSVEDAWLWSAESAITVRMQWNETSDRPAEEAGIRLKPLPEQHAQVEGAKISLAHRLTGPTIDAMRGGSRGRVEHRTVFSIEPYTQASLNMLMADIARIQSLLALATGRGPALLWLTAYLPRTEISEEFSENSHSRKVDVYTRYRGEGDPNVDAVDSHNLVFSLNDVPFADIVTKWWGVQQQFRAACNMIVGARYMTDHYIETMLIAAVSAAESFHRDLKEEPLVSRAAAEKRLQPALDALSEDDRKWLKSFIPIGFSLGQRLESLARRLPQPCRDRLLPKPSSWIHAAKRARHDLSHAGRTGDDIRKLNAIVKVTRAVVLVNILLELGLSEERLLQALSRNGELSSACRLSAKYFPASSHS